MPTAKVCPECGVEFEPRSNRQIYCSEAHAQKVLDLKRGRGTKTERVIQALGSRSCTNCRSTKPGKRFCFWWDDDDRIEEVMETARLLCAFCFKKHNSQLAKERVRVRRWELKAEPPIHTIPF